MKEHIKDACSIGNFTEIDVVILDSINLGTKQHPRLNFVKMCFGYKDFDFTK